MKIWISARELVKRPLSNRVILDVRHQVGTDSARPRYLQGHLPGAIFVELRDELAGAGSSELGRNPLPEPDTLERSLRQWGINQDSSVIVYADAGAPSAGRAWWVLRWAGVADVRILDGGLQAWTAAGGELVTDVPSPTSGDIVVRPGGLPDIELDQLGQQVLIDARTGQTWAGSPDDPDSGHIPGAVSLPHQQLLNDDGTVDLDRARAAFAELGIAAGDTVAVTCGGGVAAAYEAAVMTELGIRPLLHVGSWSQWIGDPDRPRERAS